MLSHTISSLKEQRWQCNAVEKSCLFQMGWLDIHVGKDIDLPLPQEQKQIPDGSHTCLWKVNI